MNGLDLRAEKLTIGGGADVLVRDLDLHIQGGEILAVTGRSGTGKTSLLYAVAGFIEPLAGQVVLNGRPSVLWRDAAVGVVLQNLGLVALLSAAETVALPLQARGMDRAEIVARSGSVLDRLGLADQAGQLVESLSGGQRQRVAVGRAVAGHPDVILADEPTSSLDLHWRDVVLDLLRSEARRGAAVIIATGDDEVAAVCGRRVTLG